MSLNIKNEEAHRLARELASARGTSLTEAVTEALRQSVRAEGRGADEARLVAEVAQIQDFLADIPDRDTRPAEAILGYDDYGLPG
jgi:antitoxin VapB